MQALDKVLKRFSKENQKYLEQLRKVEEVLKSIYNRDKDYLNDKN